MEKIRRCGPCGGGCHDIVKSSNEYDGGVVDANGR